MFPWLFLIFRDKWNGARIILQKCPWKLIYRKLGTIVLPRVTWCVANFLHLITLTFQCAFKCKTCLVKYDLGNVICEEPSYTMTWYERKRVWNAHEVLYTQTKIPIRKIHFWGKGHKICRLCMFRSADTILLQKWWEIDAGTSKLVWSGNTGCHMHRRTGRHFTGGAEKICPETNNLP